MAQWEGSLTVPAVRLYRRCGFREYGRLQDFFCGAIGCAEKLFMVYERS